MDPFPSNAVKVKDLDGSTAPLDPKITALIGPNLGKKPVTKLKALPNLRALSFDSYYIFMPKADLSALKYATALRRLDLSNVKLRPEDAQELALNLPKLTHLSLVSTGGNPLPLLEVCPLESLSLIGVDIWGILRQLSPNLHLTSLKSLCLEEGKAYPREVHEHVPYFFQRLTYFKIKGSLTPKTLEVIAQSSSLTYLCLGYQHPYAFEALDSLASMTQLRTLKLQGDLSHIKLTSWTFSASYITTLSIQTSKIESFSLSVPSLTKANFSCNRLEDLKSFSTCSKLQELKVRLNCLTSLEGLEALPSLTSLNVKDNLLKSKGLSALQGNSTLTSLNIDRNGINSLSLSGLVSHPELTYLSAIGNPLNDVSYMVPNTLINKSPCFCDDSDDSESEDKEVNHKANTLCSIAARNAIQQRKEQRIFISLLSHILASYLSSY